ncbi:MAG TPA: hypothetical protein VNE42_09175, partial [Acidimicrobiales bacterium]|nr:hypothetical protein [Acidimicrobiales bacterium]
MLHPSKEWSLYKSRGYSLSGQSLVVVRKDIFMRYLWVTLDLFTAFLEAKQIASDQTASLVAPLF